MHPAVDVISGLIWDGSGFASGYAIVEGGMVAEAGEGPPPCPPTVEGVAVPGIPDCHTHLADAGLKLGRRYSLQELVAPPDGLKHRYLEAAPRGRLVADMRSYAARLRAGGVSGIADFREGGAEGCRMLREAVPDAIALGRAADADGIPEVLDAADGIGIPSLTDWGPRLCEAAADEAHRRGKMVGIHVSERVREDVSEALSLEPDFVVHMCRATDFDLRACADADVPIVVCARSNLYFGTVPPLARMYRCGARVCAGTDNAMLGPPDPMAELAAFAGVLESQGGDRSLAHASFFNEGRKLLYRECNMGIRTGARADLTVFPRRGDSPLPGTCAGAVRFGPKVRR